MTAELRGQLAAISEVSSLDGSDAAAAILSWHDGLQVHCTSCLQVLDEDAVRLPSGEWWCEPCAETAHWDRYHPR